jgi:hypothetical protein
VLIRGRGMKRCRAEDAERFALFVGAAVLANADPRRAWNKSRGTHHGARLQLRLADAY